MGTSLFEQFKKEQKGGSLYDQYLAETGGADFGDVTGGSSTTAPPKAPESWWSLLTRPRRMMGTDTEAGIKAIDVHLRNAVQGIPGAEAAMARSKALLTGQPYQSVYDELEAEKAAIPGPVRIAEQMLGGGVLGKMLPISKPKTLLQALKGGTKVGAGFGAADAALSAKPQSLADRAIGTAIGGTIGGAIGGAAGGLARGADKIGEFNALRKRVANAPTRGSTAIATDDAINAASDISYGRAAKEGAEAAAGGRISPELTRLLTEHPEITPYADAVRASGADDATATRDVIALMNERVGDIKRVLKRAPTRELRIELRNLGAAKQALKDAAASASERPPITLDVAPEVFETQPRVVNPGRESATGPISGRPLNEYTTAPQSAPPAKPKTLRGAEQSEPGYVYHATNKDRLRDIADEGKLKTHKPYEFTDQDMWPDGSVERRAYFTPDAKNTWQFAPEEGAPVLLRTKQVPSIQRERGTGDLFTKKTVAASKLEYLGDDGTWHPVESFASRQPSEMQGPGGPQFQLRGQAEKVTPGVRIETPGMRVQTAPAEALPPTMPSLPGAIQERATAESEREVALKAGDAAKRIIKGTSVRGQARGGGKSPLLTDSPEAFRRDIAAMTPGQARASILDVLGAAKEARGVELTPQSTLFGTLAQALARSGTSLNRIAPYVRQLDQQAGNAVRPEYETEQILRLLGILNAPVANP